MTSVEIMVVLYRKTVGKDAYKYKFSWEDKEEIRDGYTDEFIQFVCDKALNGGRASAK